MPNKEDKANNSDGLLSSLKFRLKDEFGDRINEKDLDKITTVEGAQYLVGYFTSKNSTEEEDPKEETAKNGKLPANLGIPDLNPPDDSAIVKNLKETSEDKFLNILKPARVNNALKSNCRWNSDSRFLLVFTDEYPEGRIF